MEEKICARCHNPGQEYDMNSNGKPRKVCKRCRKQLNEYRRRKADDKPCTKEGCNGTRAVDKSGKTLGLCLKHYRERNKHLKWNENGTHSNEDGSNYIDWLENRTSREKHIGVTSTLSPSNITLY